MFNMPSWISQSMFWRRRDEIPESRYDLLRRDDEFGEKSSSSSSVDDSLLSEQRVVNLTSSRTICRSLAFFIIGLLSAVIVIMAFILAKQSLWTLKTPIPDFPRHTRNFTRQMDWEYSPRSHDLWAGLIPNSGLVLIEDPDHYGLGPGLQTSAKNAQVYGIAVTHQYHCLKMIRGNLYGLVTRNKAYTEELVASPDFSTALPDKVNHLFHCIDYLRQTVLCNADTTVEGQSRSAATHIDGYGPLHQCRNWDDVYNWMLSKLPPDPVYGKSQ